jgi:hypothetical protein
MIELTDQQIQALASLGDAPPEIVNPRTKETFVLLRADEYRRLTEVEYDDGPWTRDEIEGLAWEVGERSDWSGLAEGDDASEKP